MNEFIVTFEDSRWPDLPRVEFSVQARDRARAIDAAMALFRRTFPLENIANYVALCKHEPALTEHFYGELGRLNA